MHTFFSFFYQLKSPFNLGTCPHDAITTAEAVYPGRFAEYARGRLLIHEWAGFAAFVLDPEGPHRIGDE